MDNNVEKNTVIVLGTAHFDKEQTPVYIGRLVEIVREITPDIICAELSVDQLNGTTTCNSKPEYPDAIMPVAREMNIPIVPIQPGISEPIAFSLEERKASIYDDIRSTESGKFHLEYMEKIGEITLSNWLELLKGPNGIENVQLREFDLIQVEPEWTATEHFFPELYKLWNEWNEYFLDRINETIENHRGKLILVTVGLAHKYWLWNKLKSRDDIILHNLQSFRQARERSRSTLKQG